MNVGSFKKSVQKTLSSASGSIRDLIDGCSIVAGLSKPLIVSIYIATLGPRQ
jgi:hypothetical protein